MSHASPQLDKKAPRAEPEEDIDVLRPGAEGHLLGNRTSSRTEKGNDPEVNEESARFDLSAQSLAEEKMADLKQVAHILEAFKQQEDCEESVDPFGDGPTPPLSFTASAGDERVETGVSSYPEDEVDEWTSDGEAEEDPSDSQDVLEPAEIPPLLDEELDTTPEEVAGDSVAERENSSQLTPTSEGSQHSPSGGSYAGDVRSPLSADKKEEEEDDREGVPPYSGPLPAVPSDKQQNELFSQSRGEQALGGVDQETAQQVCSQGTPPLSTVAMELSNQGGAGCQGFGCVLALAERNNGAGERREGESESEQTGGEEGQRDATLDRGKVEKQESRGPFDPEETEKRAVSSRGVRMESDSCDDSQSDSGVSTDMSPCNTLEGNATFSAGTPTAPLKETPIEREIRRAIEREHSLRRSRGLPNSPTVPEYVEIPLRKSVLSQSIVAKSEKYQGKDREYAGKKMQLEIHEEVQREQDLVNLGKVPGFYDKGTTQELKNRKEIFEAFQKPDESSLTFAKSKASSSTDILNTTTSSDTAGSVSLVCRSEPASSVPQDRGSPDVAQERNLASPAQTLDRHKPVPELITEVDFGSVDASPRGGGGGGRYEIQGWGQEQRAAGVESSPRENPFFKLRPSSTVLRVEQDIREAQDREEELYRQRLNLYGSKESTKAGAGGPEDGGARKSFALTPLRTPTSGESKERGTHTGACFSF